MRTTDFVMALLPAHSVLSAMAAAAITNPNPPQPLIAADPLLAKYIIVRFEGQEYPILFSRDLQHNDMLPIACVKPEGGPVAVAAGFYQFISASQILCGGESQTLKLNSRIEDADIIKRHLLLQ